MIALNPIGAFKDFAFYISEVQRRGGKIFSVDIEYVLQGLMIGDGHRQDDGFVRDICEKFFKTLFQVIKKTMLEYFKASGDLDAIDKKNAPLSGEIQHVDIPYPLSVNKHAYTEISWFS
jgi:hypothetical protein